MTIMQALNRKAAKFGKQSKTVQDIVDQFEEHGWVPADGDYETLLAVACEAMEKAMAARQRNNARARARHSAMTSCGMKRTRDGRYE